MKRILLALFAFFLSINANAQFTAGQTLTAAALNAALAAPTITGGTITGAPISGSTGSFTSLTATGVITLPAGSISLSELATQAANTVLANVTGSTASPTAFTMPSCSTSSSALNYTLGTGWSCNTSINASSLGGNAANTYAPLASPALTGTPTAPTAAAGTNTTQIATTAYTQTALTGGANAGSFTTLSATGAVSGSGFSTYLASPPAIGGTAAAAGSFTTLSASSTVSGTGFSTYLASPPAIGGTTPAAGSFTTLSATGTSTLAGVTATSMTNSGLTAKSFVYSGVGGLMSSTSAPTNGQLLIGSTGNAPVAATLTGTSNQISVANGAGSITLSLPSSLAIPSISSINSVSAVSTCNGAPVIVADTLNTFANEGANIPLTTIYTVPAGQGGRYKLTGKTIVTTPASGGTPSSTLPNMTFSATDEDSGGVVSANIGATNTGNTTSSWSTGSGQFDAAASSNIQIQTNSYATAGTTSMKYKARFVLEYLCQ